MKESKEILDFQFKYEKPKRSWGKDDVLNKIYCAEIGFLINKEKKTLLGDNIRYSNEQINNSIAPTINNKSDNTNYINYKNVFL